MQSTWIPLEKIQNIIGIESFIVAWTSVLVAYIFYKLFLRRISDKRHANLKTRFVEVLWYLIIASILSIFQNQIIIHFNNDAVLIRTVSYIALAALFMGAVTTIKIAQIFIYLYLFSSNMSHGVPKLLANMFTFIFSLVICNMIASSVFEIHLTALLATSAVFSLVLGLALQDTLGNLFSGVALQIESPFKIGDWIEVHSEGAEKRLGQVQEITWRATFLMSFADELIMIPNRVIAQSQIIIISQGNKNIRLNQAFHFSHDVSIAKAKDAIREGVSEIEGIMAEPPIRILIIETSESWIEIKLLYSLVDFSARYRVGDQIITKVLESIQRNGLKIQSPKLEITKLN